MYEKEIEQATRAFRQLNERLQSAVDVAEEHSRKVGYDEHGTDTDEDEVAWYVARIVASRYGISATELLEQVEQQQ